MGPKKTEARPAGTGPGPKAENRTPDPSKIERILEALAAGRSLNRFEAERLGDHTFNSTVTDIQHRHGITVQREREVVPGWGGSETPCTRYWLAPEDREKAWRKVEGMRLLREAKGGSQ